MLPVVGLTYGDTNCKWITQTLYTILSLPFSGHFSRWNWVSQCLLKQTMMEVVVTTGAIRRAKLQLSHHHQQTSNQCFTGRMPYLSPRQHCHRTEEKFTFHGRTCSPQAHLGVFGYLSGGLPCLLSVLWCQYPALYIIILVKKINLAMSIALSYSYKNSNYLVIQCSDIYRAGND